MGEKTASVGHFQIPTAPAALTAVQQSASANTLGSAVSFGNAPSTLFITGVTIGAATTQTPTYVQIQILVAAGIVGSVLVPYGVSSAAANSVATGFRPIYPPIPVASGAAITVKSASSVASAVNWGVSLECIAQANVVDDGVAVATVTTVTNQLTAAAIATGVWQDATGADFTAASSIGKSLYTTGAVPGAAGGFQIAGSNAATTYATLTSTGAFTVSGVATVSQTGDSFAVVKSGGAGDNAAIKTKTDFLPSATAGAAGGLFIAGTNAATTITAGLTTTFTGNLTGSVASVTGAVGSVTGAVGSVTGAVGSVTGAVGSVTGAVGSVTGLTASNLDTTVSSRLATGGYTAPDNTSITAIKLKTDALTFTVAGFIDSNILKIGGVTLVGNGSGTPFNV